MAYAVLFFGTIAKRKVSHIYVANWFYGAFIIAVALLHIVNNISMPAGAFKSYSAYSGAVDAMVQWWYGPQRGGLLPDRRLPGDDVLLHPKQAGRPIYSYRLSIVHFWALIAVYMWAGPHHLLYTALPDWAQSLGMVFSLILLAPAGRRDQRHHDPVRRVAQTAHRPDPEVPGRPRSASTMMSTFEGR